MIAKIEILKQVKAWQNFKSFEIEHDVTMKFLLRGHRLKHILMELKQLCLT